MDEQKLLLLKKKLLYRARNRGFKENDLILGRFVVTNIDQLALIELEQLSNLLDQQDNDIFDWISGNKPMPQLWDDSLMAKIIQFTKINDN